MRAIAPYCRSKAADPAVVVLDECGRFAVPLLSGHLAGPMRWRGGWRRCAVRCRSSQPPPICTAFLRWTSGPNGKAALCRAGAHQAGQRRIAGGKARAFYRRLAHTGHTPAGVLPAADGSADFALTLTPTGQALHIVPRIAVLGIGCRRGTTAQHLEAAFAAFCRESGLAPQGVAAAASIDLKRDEPALRHFVRITAGAWIFIPLRSCAQCPAALRPPALSQV